MQKRDLNPSRPLFLSVLVAVMGCLSHVAASVTVAPFSVERLSNGNTLIADGSILTPSGSNSRAVEVDSLGRLVWAYVNSDVPFLHSARRLSNGHTLMASTLDGKVIEVDRNGHRKWTDSTGLVYPNWASRLDNGNTLITDRLNDRVIEVKPDLTIVWSYTNLHGPHHARRLANGHTLICDSDSNQVVEVDSVGKTVWQYGTGLYWPRSAVRLANGNTLIADSRDDRVIEVDSMGVVVWSVDSTQGAYAAVRLANGNTLFSAGAHAIEVTRKDSVVWEYPGTVPVVVETLRVVNPSSGCTLYVHIHRPAYAEAGNPVPGVVFVPGRTGFGSSLDSTTVPDDIASDGFAFLHFDPDGRGRSGAYPENYDGFVNQDGMHACESVLASRDYVDTSKLGVYTRTYGITMGSGMIARYAEPHIKFLLDFEGPANRGQTCRDSGGFVPMPADSDSFWQQREAGRFMKQVSSAYLRIQPEVDSNPKLKKNQHAIQLIDSATAVAYGGAGISVWTRVNDSTMNPANRVYGDMSNPPVWIPQVQEVQDEVRVLLYLHELADQEPTLGTRRPQRQGQRLPSTLLRVGTSFPRGELSVTLPAANSKRAVTVHDACGRLIRQAVVPAGRRKATLDLNDLPSGVYYVSATGAGTEPFVVIW
ncbi:MAG TPA: hypothetical protein VMH22_01305 [bacterium]|nr:hypothetical protein [bacterium]